MAKFSELKELNEDELENKLRASKRELLDLRMAAAAGKLDKPHRFQRVRKEVARILTFIKAGQAGNAGKTGKTEKAG